MAFLVALIHELFFKKSFIVIFHVWPVLLINCLIVVVAHTEYKAQAGIISLISVRDDTRAKDFGNLGVSWAVYDSCDVFLFKFFIFL